MRIRIPSLSLVILLLAGTATAQMLPQSAIHPSGPPAQPPTPSPQTSLTPANRKARQLVAAAIAAMGGNAYLQAKERSANGYLYTFDSKGALADAGTPIWIYQRYPADERIELTKKRNIIDIYSGGKGWEITYKGVAELPAATLKKYQNAADHSLDVILKSWAADPSTLMIDLGLFNFDQAQVDRVSFTTSDGLTADIDFSIMSHLPIRVFWRRDDPETGGHYQESVVYGNWSHVGNIVTPFSVDYFEGPQRLSQQFYNNVSFKPFPASLFTPAPLSH